MKNEINPTEVVNIIDYTLQELHQKFDPSDWTTEDREAIKTEIFEVQRLALLTKLRFQHDALVETLKNYGKLLDEPSNSIGTETLSAATIELKSIQANIEKLQAAFQKVA